MLSAVCLLCGMACLIGIARAVDGGEDRRALCLELRDYLATVRVDEGVACFVRRGEMDDRTLGAAAFGR